MNDVVLTSKWKGPVLAAVAVALLGVGGFVMLRLRNEPSRLFLNAIEDYRADDPDSAIAKLNAVLAREPGHADAILLLAQSHLKRDDIDEAIAWLSQYPDSGPEAEAAVAQLASLYLQTNRPGSAEAAFLDGMDRFPDSVRLRQAYLDLLIVHARKAEADAVLEQLWKLAQSRPVLDRMWILAKTFDRRFARRDKAETWAILQGFAHHEPDNDDTFIAMAKVRLAYGEQIDETLRRLRAIADQTPFSREANLTLLEHFVDRGGASEEEIERRLKDWPSEFRNADYHRLYGRWSLRIGDLRESKRRFITVLKARPDDWRSIHQLGTLLVRIARQNPNDAVAEANGQKLLAEAARVKEAHDMAKETSTRFRQWLEDVASHVPSENADLVRLAAQLCADANLPRQAERWRQVGRSLQNGPQQDDTESTASRSYERFQALLDDF